MGRKATRVRQKPRPLGYHWDQVDPVVHPDGRKGCRWCKRPVGKGKHSWCDDPACVEAWTFRTRNEVFRQVIWRRDRGVCGACGVDTEQFNLRFLENQRYYSDRIEHHLKPGENWREWIFHGKSRIHLDPGGNPYPADHWQGLYERALRWRAAHRVGLTEPPWQADHIRPVADGGAWFDMSNIQTLCVPHHREKTARENRDRDRSRNQRKVVV